MAPNLELPPPKMSLELLFKRPGHLIRRLQQIAVAIFFEELAGENITPMQYATLIAAREYPDLDIKRLSNLIAMDRSTLGGIIDRLAAIGLVERVMNEADKRSRLVRVSPEGEALARRLEPNVARVQVRLLDHLSERERDQFMTYMRELVHVNNSLSRAPLRHDGASHELSLYNRPGHLTRRLQQICDGIFVEYVSDFNVTPLQYASLVAIEQFPHIDNTALANLIALDRATLGSVVERLEGKGWIVRETNDTDKRLLSLIITSEGSAFLEQLRPVVARAEERIIDTLTPKGRVHFLELIERIVQLKNETSRAPQRDPGEWVRPLAANQMTLRRARSSSASASRRRSSP